MLNQRNRLKDRGLIAQLMGKGLAFRNLLFTAKFLPSPAPFSRFAVVIGKKTLKEAVDRNRLKRRINECIRNHLTPDAPPTDAVVIAKAAAAKAPNKILEKAVMEFLNYRETHAK